MKVPKRQKVPKTPPPDIQGKLGQAIKAHRLRLGVTQEELAWRADVHRTYLAGIERGARNVTIKSVANLARALQVTVEHLLAETETSPSKREGAGQGLVEILMVEDNPQDIDLALRAFRRAKFTNPVKVVGSGEEAIDYLRGSGRNPNRHAASHCMVLLDLKLPGISGMEVLRELKSDPKTRHIPIVVLATSRHDRDILASSRLGAENYIIKPLAFEHFSRVAANFNLHWALVKSPGR
ncbi:MAG TPA: response regulator [Lacunisphaera sp.]|nr:response regulator [Lacunisphaera sp.]